MLYLAKIILFNKKDDIDIDKYIILKGEKELTSKQIIDTIKDNIELPEDSVLENLWELIRDYEVIEYSSIEY